MRISDRRRLPKSSRRVRTIFTNSFWSHDQIFLVIIAQRRSRYPPLGRTTPHAAASMAWCSYVAEKWLSRSVASRTTLRQSNHLEKLQGVGRGRDSGT